MPYRDAGRVVESIVRSLVDCPECVRVTALEENGSTRLMVHVADSDAGKVIGRQGRTARAIRNVLAGISKKNHHSISLDIMKNDHLS